VGNRRKTTCDHGTSNGIKNRWPYNAYPADSPQPWSKCVCTVGSKITQPTAGSALEARKLAGSALEARKLADTIHAMGQTDTNLAHQA